MAFFSHAYRSEFWKPDDRWFFSTNSDLFYTYLQYKSEKSHGLFSLGWINQEHTVLLLLGHPPQKVATKVEECAAEEGDC